MRRIGIIFFLSFFLVKGSISQNDTICLYSEIDHCEEMSKDVLIKVYVDSNYIDVVSKFYNKYPKAMLVFKKNQCLGNNIYSMYFIDSKYMDKDISNFSRYTNQIILKDLNCRVIRDFEGCPNEFINLPKPKEIGTFSEPKND